MTRHTYAPMDSAPKDGEPIIAVCGGVECTVYWDDNPYLACWCWWDEDDGGDTGLPVKGDLTGWLSLF